MNLNTKVSFRLDRQDAEKLEEFAAVAGVSQHQYARIVLRQHFQESRAIHQHLLRLRADVGAMYQLLKASRECSL